MGFIKHNGIKAEHPGSNVGAFAEAAMAKLTELGLVYAYDNTRINFGETQPTDRQNQVEDFVMLPCSPTGGIAFRIQYASNKPISSVRLFGVVTLSKLAAQGFMRTHHNTYNKPLTDNNLLGSALDFLVGSLLDTDYNPIASEYFNALELLIVNAMFGGDALRVSACHHITSLVSNGIVTRRAFKSAVTSIKSKYRTLLVELTDFYDISVSNAAWHSLESDAGLQTIMDVEHNDFHNAARDTLHMSENVSEFNTCAPYIRKQLRRYMVDAEKLFLKPLYKTLEFVW